MGYRWSLASAILLFLLTILGALVVGLNAGFVCPNWPLCDGSLIPPLKGLVLIEYIHRLAAFLATIFIVYNAWRSWRKRRVDRLVRNLALASVLLLLLQSALGALIVVMKLPGWFTTVDVTNSMLILIVLSAMVAVGVRESREKKGLANSQVINQANGYRRLAFASAWTTIAIVLQTVIGGYFRHSGDSQALFGQHSYLLSHFEHGIPSLDQSVIMLIVHVGFTLVIMAGIVYLAFLVATMGVHRTPVALLILLTLYQIALGIISLQTKLSLTSDTMHFAGAAAMVVVAGYLWMIASLEQKPRGVLSFS